MKVLLPIPQIAALAAFVLLQNPTRADLLTTAVTGTLNFNANPLNYFDSANGLVPPGFANSLLNSPTVTIQNPKTEFGFSNDCCIAKPDDLFSVSADFTGSTLTITEGGRGSSQALVTMTFTDIALAGLTLTEITDTFPELGGVTANLVGNVITMNFVQSLTPVSGTAVYNLSSVPEASTSLALAGFCAVGGVSLWRRLSRQNQSN